MSCAKKEKCNHNYYTTTGDHCFITLIGDHPVAVHFFYEISVCFNCFHKKLKIIEAICPNANDGDQYKKLEVVVNEDKA